MNKANDIINSTDALLAELRAELRGMIAEARIHVSQVANAALTTLYWRIGQRIHHDILTGKRADYGKRIVASLGRQLGWSHFKALISIQDPLKRDFIPPTDIARYKNLDRSDDLVRNWLLNQNTLEFLGNRDQFHNPGFNSVEFDGIKTQAGLNSFTLTPKQWIEKTGAIGQMQTLTYSSLKTARRRCGMKEPVTKENRLSSMLYCILRNPPPTKETDKVYRVILKKVGA